MILERLREWRESAGLTQSELADVAKVTPFTVSRAEKGGSLRVTSAKKLADALGVTVKDLQGEPPTPAPKAPTPKRAGHEGLPEMLKRLGAKTRHLADPNLVTSLETASDATISRVVRETRRELEVLLPELRRLRDGTKPGDPSYMPVNRAIADATRQVLVAGMYLRERDETKPQDEALAAAAHELFELAVAG